MRTDQNAKVELRPDIDNPAHGMLQARERIRRVFRYLQALNEHRNPVRCDIREYRWLQWLHELPSHESLEVAQISSGAIDGSESEESRTEPYVLKVRRPVFTQPPAPPDRIADWLERGWKEPTGPVQVRGTLEAGAGADARTVQFEDDRQRVWQFQQWERKWQEWAMAEQPARETAALFDRLFALHADLQREGEHFEIVLGDGILTWNVPSGLIRHPILLQRLQLEFDPAIPEFTLVETDSAVELYTALFRAVPEVPPATLGSLRAAMHGDGCHPLEGDITTRFLRRMAGSLATGGQYIADCPSVDVQDYPQVCRAPVIFVRDRSQGFAAFLEHVLEDLHNREDLPSTLTGIVGVHDGIEPPATQLTAAGEEPERIYLSKVANPEQIRVAEYVEHSTGVLVQGPPGTGKTHTIGNLLGHLLAQGQNVLVTSHTTKALRVLREKVVESLQPLCVSVLESDTQSQGQLQQSIQTIVARLGSSDADHLESEATRLAAHRALLLEAVRSGSAELLQVRASEYDPIVVSGVAYDPSAAARRVRAGVSTHDWIPAPVEPGAALPLSSEELRQLYASNRTISRLDEQELAHPLPALESLVPPDVFADVVADIARLRADREAKDHRQSLWSRAPVAGDEDALTALLVRLEKALLPLEGGEAGQTGEAGEWQLAAIAAGLRNVADRKAWQDFDRLVRDVVEQAGTSQAKLLELGPELPAVPELDAQIKMLEQINAHLEQGGSLGAFSLVFNPSWKRFLAECRVDGRVPTSRTHVQALLLQARLVVSRAALRRRWDRQMTPLGAPAATELGDEPERVAFQYTEQIAALLDWYELTCQPLEQDLRAAGFDWSRCLRQQRPQTGKHADLIKLRDALQEQMIPAVRAQADQARLASLEQEMEARLNSLTGFAVLPSIDALRSALNVLDVASYENAHRRIVELHNKAALFEVRARLLETLERAAPRWAAALRKGEGVHNKSDAPGDIAEAWLWRQLNEELVRRSAVSLEAIEKDLESKRQQLTDATADLIERRAWAAQVRRTTPEQRQALMGYRDAVRRIGRGTGKRAPKFRVEAQKLMGECRSAVPVWIMPLATVADTFDPRNTRFKVAIIDEASQCDVMGLIAFYLADKVLVVGDDEQVSPAAVGQKLDVVEALIEEHLREVPNRKLYDGQMSIYELAQQSFSRNVRLVEHFRCVPAIIEFSNHLSYDGQITPLRDPGNVVLRPYVVEQRVSGQESGKVNRVEAIEIASLVAAALEQPEYARSSFGVISLLGDEQAYEIERLLRTQLTPAIMEKHRILCGNAAQFQGDERDVMFLSMVKSPLSSAGPHPLMGQGYLDANKKRFNVAASRARNQMWVVHSLDPATDLKSGDLRLRLIQHAQTPHAVTEAIRRAESRAESELEQLVMRDLRQAGYQVTPQWWVGYYRIDIVVVGAHGQKMAIECEGDRHHPQDKLAEDVARQAVLERLGWEFIRIRGSLYYRESETVMRDVMRRLSLFGIEPWDGIQPSAAPAPGDELVERVRNRAAEIRSEWQPAREDATAAIEEISVESVSSEPATAEDEDDDAVEEQQCIQCGRSDRVLVLYRGSEMCTACIEDARREVSSVPLQVAVG